VIADHERVIANYEHETRRRYERIDKQIGERVKGVRRKRGTRQDDTRGMYVYVGEEEKERERERKRERKRERERERDVRHNRRQRATERDH